MVHKQTYRKHWIGLQGADKSHSLCPSPRLSKVKSSFAKRSVCDRQTFVWEPVASQTAHRRLREKCRTAACRCHGSPFSASCKIAITLIDPASVVSNFRFADDPPRIVAPHPRADRLDCRESPPWSSLKNSRIMPRFYDFRSTNARPGFRTGFLFPPLGFPQISAKVPFTPADSPLEGGSTA